MSGLPKTLEKIIDSFSRLPGIGKKTAQRLGMHLIKMDPDFISDFANALNDIDSKIHLCSICNNFSELDKVFNKDEFVFVKNNDFINDFHLFSHAKHFILGPSSFHWWGAWLNKNKNKICIRPPDHLNPSDNKDFWPMSWTIV